MIISDFGLKPEQTIYYISGQILKVLKQEESAEENIITKIFGISPQPYEIYRFNLALYLLLLLDKFRFYDKNGELIYVYQETGDKDSDGNNQNN